ncbi:IS630-Spn1, transposase Orf1 [Streptococcus pneumoniae]|nr:IS630-Spn1, transposase Orf1 [Streptococcus pneumoniae]
MCCPSILMSTGRLSDLSPSTSDSNSISEEVLILRAFIYSIDFRKKVLSYCERTGSITEASHVFQISRNTIYGWVKLKEKTGELNHQVKGTKPRKVDRDRLKNYLTDNPDAYLTEIASEFGCHPTTIHYALKAMGLH